MISERVPGLRRWDARADTPDDGLYPDDPQPYTLWYDTLPSDDTARLLIWPRAGEVQVVLFWNGDVHSERTFATIEAAEEWGCQLYQRLEQDALAGALLGYDHDVLARLIAA